MPYDVKKNRREEARKLRKKGWSYSEIQKKLALSKSTVASWVRRLKLTDEQRQELDERRRSVAKKNSVRRSQSIIEFVGNLRKASSKKIGTLSRRELWLMGIALLWKAKGKKKIVSFSSSDPILLRFFLKWLRDIGGLKKEEIALDIFGRVGSASNTKEYWSKATGFPQEHFSHVYNHTSDFLRVRVKASSMLARQIAGWTDGLAKSI